MMELYHEKLPVHFLKFIPSTILSLLFIIKFRSKQTNSIPYVCTYVCTYSLASLLCMRTHNADRSYTDATY